MRNPIRLLIAIAVFIVAAVRGRGVLGSYGMTRRRPSTGHGTLELQMRLVSSSA